LPILFKDKKDILVSLAGKVKMEREGNQELQDIMGLLVILGPMEEKAEKEKKVMMEPLV
jgi:hypothetical protein